MKWHELINTIPDDEIQRLLKWYYKMNHLERLDVHQLQSDLIRKNHKLQANIYHKSYAYLILALAKRSHLLMLEHKKLSVSDSQAKKISDIRLQSIIGNKRIVKGSNKEKQIRIKYFPIILDLLENEMSWRKISAYLKKHHRFNASHEYLRKVYTKIAYEISE